jgi:hypothetical protein
VREVRKDFLGAVHVEYHAAGTPEAVRRFGAPDVLGLLAGRHEFAIDPAPGIGHHRVSVHLSVIDKAATWASEGQVLKAGTDGDGRDRHFGQRGVGVAVDAGSDIAAYSLD